MPDAVTTAGDGASYKEKLESLSFVGRSEPPADTDKNGHVVTPHEDGSVDVQINVTEPVRVSSQTHEE